MYSKIDNCMRPLLFLMCLWFYLAAAEESDLNKEVALSVEEIITKYGYPFEEHGDIETEDGYFLTIYRIPYGKENTNETRPAVLFMHGLTGSSRNFVSMGPKRGLAFVLADNGYDVWLGNSRGTTVSRKHRQLDADKDGDYWKFGWHEIGYYDTPAMFERIHNVTKLESISYIGHSQGTTTFYVFATTRPEYNKNVTVAVSLGPQAYMNHVFTPWVTTNAKYAPLMELLIKLTGVYYLPLLEQLSTLGIQLACTLKTLQPICATFFYAAGGFSPNQSDTKDLPRLTVGFPAFGTRQALHYGHNVNSGKFRWYDYGPIDNRAKYGTDEPPDYDLSKITSPQAIYYSPGDWLVGKKDVTRFCKEVSNCAYAYKVPNKRFSHYDFIFAKDVVKLVFNDLVKTLARFNNNCKEIKAC